MKKTKIFYSFTECDEEVQRLKRLQKQHPLRPEAIPTELVDLDQWVVWSYEVHRWKNGTFGVGKVPYQAKIPNRKASRTTSLDWCDLETAVRCVKNDCYHVDGIGFVFSRADGLSGVDFDNCRDPITGYIPEEYQFWIDALGGYAEVSPSGTGVKVWVKGTISNRYFKSEESTGFRILNFAGGEIEVYRRGQYFTVTTQCLKDVEFITPAQTELDVLSEWSLSKVSRDISYYCSSVFLSMEESLTSELPFPVPTDEDVKRELSLLQKYWDEISYGYIDELYSQAQPMPQSVVGTLTDSDLYPIGDVSYIDLGQSRCCRCGRKCKPQYELCGECYKDGEPEDKVKEAVFNYFSEPKFRKNGFSPKYEHEIRIGTYTPRPDVVLFDQQGNLVAVVECKHGGIVGYGIDQLKSYLTASDVQLGVFANSTEPDEWIFFENLRRYHFKDDISRSQFEAEIVADRPIESIREEKNKLDEGIQKASDQHAQTTREVDSSCKQLDELNEKIEWKNKQLAKINEEVAPLRKESSNLKAENTRLKDEIIQNSKRAKVVKGLKLESTRDSLRKTIDLLSTEKDQLQNEIGMKEQQHTRLSEKINLLREDKGKLESFLKENRDKLKRRENKIRYDRESLKREQEKSKTLKHTNNYLDEINAKLQRQIDHKTSAIPELNRLSKLDELEAAFAQESIYGQLQKEFERLEELESKIARKQQLARQDQEKYAAYERNRLETNEKEQQLVQVSQEKESTLKQLRVVVNQLKTANLEQNSQIEVNRKQLVQDLRKHKCRCVQLTREISELKGIKSSLEEEIRQEGQQVLFEEGEACPAYVKIQLEIDELKIEKSKIEAKIGHQIFLRLP